MSGMPENIRVHYARQAPSPHNWYSQDDYAGCLITWEVPDDAVGYVFFRTHEPLDSDCGVELMSGRMADLADRLDVHVPIKALVDDEIHDRNRYVIFAELASGGFVNIRKAGTRKFTDRLERGELEPLAFWSNPGGEPRRKDPLRLNYLTVKPGDFCGFSWSYPEEMPDCEGFDLIISRQAISPHTGNEFDIEDFKRVLRGEFGACVQLESYVTAVQDNQSSPGTYWYYALLARDPRGGRLEIPCMHHDTPFLKGRPFRYLNPDGAGKWGVGQEILRESHGRWVQQHLRAREEERRQHEEALAAAAPPPVVVEPEPEEEAEEAYDSPEVELDPEAWAGVILDTPPSLDSYADDASFVGVRISWTAEAGAMMVALRARAPLAPEDALAVVQGRLKLPHCDRVEFDIENVRATLVDLDCHTRSWYLIVNTDFDPPRPETWLRTHPLYHLPPIDDNVIYWHCPGDPLHDRLVHTLEVESARKRRDLIPIEIGVHEVLDPVAIELYLFRTEIDWRTLVPEDLEEFYKLQRGEESDLGVRYVLPNDCVGFRDDISPNRRRVYYAALVRDQYNNRTPVPIFPLTEGTHGEWPLLSRLIRQPELSQLSPEDFLTEDERSKPGQRPSRDAYSLSIEGPEGKATFQGANEAEYEEMAQGIEGSIGDLLASEFEVEGRREEGRGAGRPREAVRDLANEHHFIDEDEELIERAPRSRAPQEVVEPPPRRDRSARVDADLSQLAGLIDALDQQTEQDTASLKAQLGEQLGLRLDADVEAPEEEPLDELVLDLPGPDGEVIRKVVSLQPGDDPQAVADAIAAKHMAALEAAEAAQSAAAPAAPMPEEAQQAPGKVVTRVAVPEGEDPQAYAAKMMQERMQATPVAEPGEGGQQKLQIQIPAGVDPQAYIQSLLASGGLDALQGSEPAAKSTGAPAPLEPAASPAQAPAPSTPEPVNDSQGTVKDLSQAEASPEEQGYVPSGKSGSTRRPTAWGKSVDSKAEQASFAVESFGPNEQENSAAIEVESFGPRPEPQVESFAPNSPAPVFKVEQFGPSPAPPEPKEYSEPPLEDEKPREDELPDLTYTDGRREALRSSVELQSVFSSEGSPASPAREVATLIRDGVQTGKFSAIPGTPPSPVGNIEEGFERQSTPMRSPTPPAGEPEIALPELEEVASLFEDSHAAHSTQPGLEWLPVIQVWHFVHIKVGGEGALEVLWTDAEAPPEIPLADSDATIERLHREGTLHRYELGKSSHFIDNLTRVKAYIIARRRQAEGFEQQQIEFCAPPWRELEAPAVLLERQERGRLDDEVAARITRARDALELGQASQARKALKEARTIDPNNIRIRAFERAHLGMDDP